MGFFPAVGVAWIASKENFLQGISNTLSFLKVRASWGKVGNDGIISTPRFVYMQELAQGQQVKGSGGREYYKFHKKDDKELWRSRCKVGGVRAD